MRVIGGVRKALAVAATGAAVMLWPALAGAQGSEPKDWPTRTVKIVTPQPAGTAIDIGLRLFADRLAKRWGQGVVVENRPGGDGIPATAAFIQAKDDHALFGSPGYPFTIAPSVLDKLPYDPNGDVTPISLLVDTPLMISVNARVAAQTLGELEKLAKAQPGKLNWASTAGLPNFAFNYFVKSADLQMAYVPYRDAASALNDVGEGRIEAYVTSYGTVMSQVAAGKLRVIAMLGRSRIPLAPSVPTTAEAGYPKVLAEGFSGLYGIKGMAPALRDRIAADAKAVADDAEVREVLAKSAQVPRGLPPGEFRKVLDEQRTHVAEMLAAIGFVKKPAP